MIDSARTSADFNPAIAFGLSAQTVALKARTGQLRQADRLRLAEQFFAWLPEDAGARDAVGAFLSVSAKDPVAAGLALEDWVISRAAEMAPIDLERRLSEVQAEFEWQKRADLQ